MKVLEGPAGVHAATGTELGVSDWHTVSQDQIDAFARVTGDNYWLHTDPDRAAGSAFGSTIAHGLLTLSLGPTFTYSIVTFAGFTRTLNYGYEKVRFIGPVPAGSRIRMRSEILEVSDVAAGLRVKVRQTFEASGGKRPVCVADSMLALLTG